MCLSNVLLLCPGPCLGLFCMMFIYSLWARVSTDARFYSKAHLWIYPWPRVAFVVSFGFRFGNSLGEFWMIVLPVWVSIIWGGIQGPGPKLRFVIKSTFFDPMHYMMTRRRSNKLTIIYIHIYIYIYMYICVHVHVDVYIYA